MVVSVTLLAGQRGMYRVKRQELIEASLNGYKKGVNGGRRRLMLDKRPEEFERKSEEETIPAQVLTESERLTRNLPRIMGDG